MLRVRIATQSVFFLQRLTTKYKQAKDTGLHRVAALIRGAVIRNLRYSSKASSPGRPPHVHTRGGLRIIEFVVNSANSEAIIGPVKFSNSNFFNQPVPRIHEFGGTYFSRKGMYHYPERSYMSYTLKQLHARGKISREFATEITRRF